MCTIAVCLKFNEIENISKDRTYNNETYQQSCAVIL